MCNKFKYCISVAISIPECEFCEDEIYSFLNGNCSEPPRLVVRDLKDSQLADESTDFKKNV